MLLCKTPAKHASICMCATLWIKPELANLSKSITYVEQPWRLPVRGFAVLADKRSVFGSRKKRSESVKKLTFACSYIFTGSPWKQHLCKENRPAGSRGWPPLPTFFPKGPEKRNSFSGNDGIHKCRLENRDLTCARKSIAICCLTDLKGRLLSAPQWQIGEAGMEGVGGGVARSRATCGKKKVGANWMHSPPTPSARCCCFSAPNYLMWAAGRGASSPKPSGLDLRYVNHRRLFWLPLLFAVDSNHLYMLDTCAKMLIPR